MRHLLAQMQLGPRDGNTPPPPTPLAAQGEQTPPEALLSPGDSARSMPSTAGASDVEALLDENAASPTQEVPTSEAALTAMEQHDGSCQWGQPRKQMHARLTLRSTLCQAQPTSQKDEVPAMPPAPPPPPLDLPPPLPPLLPLPPAPAPKPPAHENDAAPGLVPLSELGSHWALRKNSEGYP